MTPRHLNKHIDYDASPQPAATQDKSLSLPLGIAVSADGTTLYVAAFGSSKIGVFDTSDLESDRLIVFHAATTTRGEELVTSGGRVVSVTALGSTFAEAADASREGAARIEFEGAFIRSDIGWRERARRPATPR